LSSTGAEESETEFLYYTLSEVMILLTAAADAEKDMREEEKRIIQIPKNHLQLQLTSSVQLLEPYYAGMH